METEVTGTTRVPAAQARYERTKGELKNLRDCFYSGTATHPMYVDYFRAASGSRELLPIVMLHGGFHTGSIYLTTPDGRQGWAPYFSLRGHDVYVVDWPGHGRSPASDQFSNLSIRDIAEALQVLLDDVGPAIVFAHSAAGPIAWKC